MHQATKLLFWNIEGWKSRSWPTAEIPPRDEKARVRATSKTRRPEVRKLGLDRDIGGILRIEREGGEGLRGKRAFMPSCRIVLIVREIVDQSRAMHTGILGEEIGQKEH